MAGASLSCATGEVSLNYTITWRVLFNQHSLMCLSSSFRYSTPDAHWLHMMVGEAKAVSWRAQAHLSPKFFVSAAAAIRPYNSIFGWIYETIDSVDHFQQDFYSNM